ncbi:MAG: hypothetical protein KDH09_15750 [Chrysiogenetes bacterium]|nr:hypothetical protein [Chrysiogenetes bacterium]
MPLRDPQAQEDRVSKHSDGDDRQGSDDFDHNAPRVSLAEVSAQVDELGDRLSAILEPLSPAQRRRALGQLQARLEHNLPAKEQATDSALNRKALYFGLGTLIFGGALFLVSHLSAALSALSGVGQLVSFAGLFILLGPVSRMISDLLSARK